MCRPHHHHKTNSFVARIRDLLRATFGQDAVREDRTVAAYSGKQKIIIPKLERNAKAVPIRVCTGNGMFTFRVFGHDLVAILLDLVGIFDEQGIVVFRR